MKPKILIRKLIPLTFSFACVLLATVSPQWMNELRAQVYNASPVCTITSPLGTQRIMAGDSLSFAGNITDPDGDPVFPSWRIDPSNGVDLSQANTADENLGTVTFNAAGSFVVALEATDLPGASCDSVSVTVIVEADDTTPPLQVTIDADRTSIDTGDTVNFTSTITPSDAQVSLSWNVTPETGVTPASGNQSAFAPRFDEAGEFRVTLQAIRPGQAPVTSNPIDIMVRELPSSTIQVSIQTPSASPTTGQRNSFSAVITGLPPSATPSFTWSVSPGDGVIPGVTNQQTFNPTFIVPGNYTITVSVATDRQETTADISVEVGGEVNANALAPLTQPGTPQFSIAQVIDRICPDPDRTLSGTLQADCDAMIGAALSGDTEQATAAVNAITPDAVSALKNDALASIGLQAVNIAGRLTALRTGAGGFSTAGLNIDLGGTRISGRQMQSLVDALSGGGASADDSGFSRLGVFVSGTLASGDRDKTSNAEGFDYDVYGLTVGVDYRLNDNLILGGALGYSSTEADVDNDRGTLDADSYAITFYGSYYRTDNFFIDSSLSYGRSDYDQERRVRYTLPNINVSQDFFSDFDGDQFGIFLSTGYEMRFSELLVVPTARLQYIRATVDGYSEDRASNPGEPGSGLNVEIDDQTYRSFALGLGGQVSYAMSQSWGVLLPYASLEYVHDFEKNDSAVTGRFVNDDPIAGKVPFTLPVDSRDQNYFNFSIGASAQFTNGTAGFVNYEQLLGYSDVSQYRINAGLRFEF